MKKWNEEMAIESIHIMLIDHETLCRDKGIDSEEVMDSHGKLLQAIQKLVKEVQENWYPWDDDRETKEV